MAPSGNLISIAFISFGETKVGSDGSSLSYTPTDIQFSESVDSGIVSSISPSISTDGCVSRFDCDGDGVSNFTELKEGTDPEDANSFPFCGNNNLESNEACDDGNVADGDGCAKTCVEESLQPVCGNGQLEGNEECDDGNVTNGDGCSGACVRTLDILSFGTEKTIQVGESSELTWTVAHADSISMNQDIGALDIADTSLTVKPSITTTYKLSASRAGKVVTKEVTIHVNYPPTIPTLSGTPGRTSSSDTVFRWTDTSITDDDSTCSTLSYTIEVQKADGTAVVTKTGLSSKSFDVASLVGSEKIEPRTDYKWRVTSQDNCGASATTAFQSFTTKDEWLVGWWRFDEGSGTTAKDSSGNGNDGTLQGTNGLPTRTAGVSGNALSFDGVDNFVALPTSINSPFTMPEHPSETLEGWVKPDNNPPPDTSFLINAHGGLYVFASYNYSAPFFDGGSDGNFVNLISNGIDLLDGNWHHMLATTNGNMVSLYVDGSLVDTRPEQSLSITTDDIANLHPVIGAGYFPASYFRFFHGLIDEVAIYSRALTTAEIRDNCQRNNPAGDICAADDVPTQKTPSGGLTLPPTRAYLSWEAGIVPSGKTFDHYELCYSATGVDLSITQNCDNFTKTTTPYFVVDALSASTTYTWKVKSCYNSIGTDCSAYTPVWSFATDDSVVGWWTFDGENLLDSSDNHLDGTATYPSIPLFSANGNHCYGPDDPIASGLLGLGVCFDGVDDYLLIPTQVMPTSSDSAFTMSARVNIASVLDSPSKVIVATTGSLVTMRIAGDLAEFGKSGGGGPLFLQGRSISTNTWHNIVGVYDGTDAFIYLDGVLANGPSGRTWPSSHGTTTIGASDVGGTIGEFMSGLMDEVSIYNNALSDDVILNNFCATEALARSTGSTGSPQAGSGQAGTDMLTDPRTEVCR